MATCSSARRLTWFCPIHRELDAQREILKAKTKSARPTRHWACLRRQSRADRLACYRFGQPGCFQEKNSRRRIQENNEILKAFGASRSPLRKCSRIIGAGDYLKPFVAHTVILVHEAVTRVMISYSKEHKERSSISTTALSPFVTSSNTSRRRRPAPARASRPIAWTGWSGVHEGLQPRAWAKARCPHENAEIADMLHPMGREFGATTGRASPLRVVRFGCHAPRPAWSTASMSSR